MVHRERERELYQKNEKENGFRERDRERERALNRKNERKMGWVQRERERERELYQIKITKKTG